MKITSISYCKTIQLKQYEPLKIEAVAEVSEGESPSDAMRELELFVDSQLGIKTAVAKISEAIIEKIVEPEPKPVKKKAKKKVVKKVVKPTPYSRGNATHKAILVDLLNDHCIGWKSYAPQVKEVSVAMEGKPFLDEKTQTIVGTFSDEFNERVGKIVEL